LPLEDRQLRVVRAHPAGRFVTGQIPRRAVTSAVEAGRVSTAAEIPVAFVELAVDLVTVSNQGPVGVLFIAGFGDPRGEDRAVGGRPQPGFELFPGLGEHENREERAHQEEHAEEDRPEALAGTTASRL
jgi:hypothetical protein